MQQHSCLLFTLSDKKEVKLKTYGNLKPCNVLLRGADCDHAVCKRMHKPEVFLLASWKARIASRLLTSDRACACLR